MSIAPTPQLTAALAVLHHVAVSARRLGYEGSTGGLPSVDCMRLADMMDAIHELPRLLAEWERCDEKLLRMMLEGYDERWNGGLLVMYERTLAEHLAAPSAAP
jgi:hypothetical protein